MPWKPGQTGNPNGRPKKVKDWADAIRLVANEPDEEEPNKKKIRKLAEQLFRDAMGGNVTASKEIGDRLDGKPVQGIEASGPDGGPIESADVSARELARRMLSLIDQAEKEDG